MEARWAAFHPSEGVYQARFLRRFFAQCSHINLLSCCGSNSIGICDLDAPSCDTSNARSAAMDSSKTSYCLGEAKKGGHWDCCV
mmetsp:Transcript_9392/g.15079  ORF Transcript_9392/g.15079 Transcript_9392/m.15079 type:complete len:84 (-) Transcript_9392:279-530(-)